MPQKKISYISFLVVTTLLSTLSSAVETKKVYISLVPKSALNISYYNRLATSEGLIITTKDKPAFAKESILVTLEPQESLYLVELVAENDPSVPGQVGRIKNVLLSVLPQNSDSSHVHLGSALNYVEKVELGDLQKADSRVVKKFIRSKLDPRSDLKFEINKDELKRDLEAFSGFSTTTINGEETRISERGSSRGRAQAIAWLKEQYASSGFSVSTHDYEGGSNFIAEKAGTDTSKVIILSAHLDSVGNAGADDDGSGTISVLAAARVLSELPLRYNLRIVGFDQEEMGLVGSKKYAAHLKKTNKTDEIVGLFNVEMSGYDGDNDGALHIIDCEENTSAELTKLVSKAITDYNLELTKSPACTNRSDHAAFWPLGVPAIVMSQNFFGGDSNPCYHEECDKTDIINWDYMTEFTKALAYGVGSAIIE